MTRALYWEDAYLRTAQTRIADVKTENGGALVAPEETVFFPRGGGQPGDCGEVRPKNGAPVAVAETTKDRETGIIWHHLQTDSPPPKGAEITLVLDWARRRQHMRVHTAMHLLCAAVNAPVTGGSIGALRGRLDFDLQTPPDKAEIEEKIRRWIESDAPVLARWTDEKELDENPSLMRAMSAPPPRGGGKVRLVEIAGIDLQACGGTHVASLGEIGALRVKKMEKKGRINRRIIFELG